MAKIVLDSIFSLTQKISEKDSIVWLKKTEFYELHYSDNKKLTTTINAFY